MFFPFLIIGQTIEDFSLEFPNPPGTGNVVFPAGTLSGYEGGLIQAFVGSVPVGPSSGVTDDGSSGLAIFYGLALPGDQIDFYILHNDTIIVTVTVDPPIIFYDNLFEVLSGDMINYTLHGSGETVVFGCTDSNYLEYDPSVNLDDGSCATILIFGCIDDHACNFNFAANTDDGSCIIASGCETCNDQGGVDANDEDGDGICDADEILGCTNEDACNFNQEATSDDGSCFSLKLGLTVLERFITLVILSIIFMRISNQNPPLSIDLYSGWNLIGYPCSEPIDAEEAFSSIVEDIELVKDNNGTVYWPEFNFNGIGQLETLEGYQINLNNLVVDFSFCGQFICLIILVALIVGL